MVWHVGNWTVFVFASVVAGFSASVQDDLRTDCNVKYIIPGLGDFGDRWCGTYGSGLYLSLLVSQQAFQHRCGVT